MKGLTKAENMAGTNTLALRPAPHAAIVTRKHLAPSKRSDKHGLVKAKTEAEAEAPALVTRQTGSLFKRRGKHVLMAVAVILAVFPPMWAVYLISWLVWRSRPKQQSMRRVRKAISALKKNQTGVALKHLQDAHYLNPSNSDALYWLGLLMSQQGRHDEAVEALSLVAERVPGLPEVETALSEAYVAMNQPEEAVYHAQRLLEAAPYAPESLLKLAKALEAAGRLDLAIQTLEQAPLHKRVLTDTLTEVHYYLGILYEHQDDPAQALHHFNRVYARDISYKDVRRRVQTLKAGEETTPT